MRNTFGSVVMCLVVALLILRIEHGRTLRTAELKHSSQQLPSQLASDAAGPPEGTTIASRPPSEIDTAGKNERTHFRTQRPPEVDNPYLALFASEREPRNRANATAEYLSQVVYVADSELPPRVSNKEEQAANPYLTLEVAHTTEEQRTEGAQNYLQRVSVLP